MKKYQLLVSDIQAINSLDLNLDWSWYEGAILLACELHKFIPNDQFDTDDLNARKISDAKILEWIDKNLDYIG